MQKEVRRFRRGTGRREKLGGAVQGQGCWRAVSGDTDAAGAADHAGGSRQNHLETLRLELAGTAVYRAEERRFVFGNGSVLQFGYCACDRDADRYQGAEYDVIFFDEATQLKEQWMRKLAACVRGVNGFPKRIYYTCNPGGPGHGYIKRLFIDRRYEPGENGGEYAFIPARVTDNGRCWRGSRSIYGSWRRCRRSCGRRGWRGGGTCWRDRCSRSSRTTRRTTRTGGGRT